MQYRLNVYAVMQWNQELEKNEVLVMVAQILSDMLCHNFITFQQVSDVLRHI